MGFDIRPARGAQDLDSIRLLFRAYVDWLGIDLSFQDFEAELAGLPGKYAAPAGELFLARRDDGEILGCVGLRPWHVGRACELKRLFVSEEGRGMGIGRALTAKAIEQATLAGYDDMLLDTLPSMTSAIAVYRSLGFEEIAPYWNNIIPGVLYFGKRLTSTSAARRGSGFLG